MQASASIVCGDTSIPCDQWLAVLDELNIGAFTVNLDHRITAINHCAQALIGLRAVEILGKECREVFTGVPCMVNCMVGSGSGRQAEEVPMQVTDEDQRQHLITRMATPIFNLERQVVGCLTVLQDHSPISDLIDRLRYEERSLKNILDSLDVGVFTTNRGGLITFFNTAAEQISGYARSEVLGLSCACLLGGSDRPSVLAIQDVIARDTSHRGQESWLRDKEGSAIPIRSNYVALRDEKGAVVGSLATFQDMTLVHQLDQVTKNRYTCFDMIGKSASMLKIFAMIPVVAASGATVLIEGPTGTGKDLLAKIIHAASPRKGKPWVKINCAAIPDSLIESEIFGYVKGAFTGADRDKPGRFQEAAGGTIFLDEIGDLPLALQAKLLRVLEEKEFYPLGSRRTVKVDVRIISATNRKLEQLVGARQFREDLYYRLNVVRIVLPSLEARRDDLPLLIRHILRKLCAARGLAPVLISEDAMGILLNHAYPGNVRELENILEHALILSGAGPIQRAHLPATLTASATVRPPQEGRSAHEPAHEADRIAAALTRFSGHRGKAARHLRMDRTTLWRKMKRYGLD
jgi:PAS domain S-box-containing protein